MYCMWSSDIEQNSPDREKCCPFFFNLWTWWQFLVCMKKGVSLTLVIDFWKSTPHWSHLHVGIKLTGGLPMQRPSIWANCISTKMTLKSSVLHLLKTYEKKINKQTPYYIHFCGVISAFHNTLLFRISFSYQTISWNKKFFFVPLI